MVLRKVLERNSDASSLPCSFQPRAARSPATRRASRLVRSAAGLRGVVHNSAQVMRRRHVYGGVLPPCSFHALEASYVETVHLYHLTRVSTCRCWTGGTSSGFSRSGTA